MNLVRTPSPLKRSARIEMRTDATVASASTSRAGKKRALDTDAPSTSAHAQKKQRVIDADVEIVSVRTNPSNRKPLEEARQRV